MRCLLNVLQYAKKDTCVRCPYIFYSAVFLAVSFAVRSMQVSRVGTSPMNALSAESVAVRKKGHLREVYLSVLFGRMQVSRVRTSPMNALSAECVAVRKKGHLREVPLYILFGCFSRGEPCRQKYAGQQSGDKPH